MSKPSLTKTELEIMQYIWSINSEVTATDVREHFSYKNWSKQSVGFFLKKLVTADYLKIRKESANKYFYSAIITEQEYSILSIKEIVKKTFNDSFGGFFACFCQDFTKEDIHELDQLISDLKKNSNISKSD